MAQQVTGDADSVRRAGRSWGTQAQAAEAQVNKLRTSASTVSVQHLTGPAGDRVRLYLSQLQTSASAVATAYDRLAVAAPRVADAIEDAKRAEAKRDKAKEALAKAVTALGKAHDEFAAAVAALALASAKTLLPGRHADTAAEQQAVERAGKAVTAAQHVHDDAERLAKQAETAFQHADDDRVRMSSTFAQLCRTQMQAANQAMPSAPAPPHVPTGLTLATYVKSLANIKIAGLNAIAKYAHTAPGVPVPGGSLANLEKFTERAGSVLKVTGYGLSAATSVLQVLGRDDLDTRGKAEQATKTFLTGTLGSTLGSATGGAACSVLPVAEPVCVTGGGILGGALFTVLGKIKPVDDAASYVVHKAFDPYVNGGKKIVHAHDVGDVAEGAVEIGAAPLESGASVVKDGFNAIFH